MITFSFVNESFFVFAENEITITDSNFIIEEYISGLKYPVMIDFLDEQIVVIEKDLGNVRIIKDGVLVSEPILNIEVSKTIEEGLIGILVSENDVFLHYTTADANNKTTSNWFQKYAWNGDKLIFEENLIAFHNGNGMHNSGVMIKNENGDILAGIGDIGDEKSTMQNSFNAEIQTGKIFSLLTPDEIFAAGIRNTYGIDFDPVTGFLWDTENGPEFFDEVNLVKEKFNSGWNSVQGPINDGQKIPFIEGFEYSDPEFSWERPIGATAIHFVNSPLFPNNENSVLVGSFHDGILYKFELNEKRNGFVFNNSELTDLVLHKNDNPNEIILGTGFAGITDIKQGPDGFIYIVTIGDGKIFRLMPNLNEKILKSDCEKILDEKNFSKCNFTNVVLKDKDFSNQNFKFASFKDSSLENINFSNTNLVGANFENVEIINTNFANSNLDSSIFIDTNFKNVSFSESSMISSNLQNVILKETNFENSNLERSIFDNLVVNEGKFQNSNLIKSKFSNTKLDFSNFSGTDLTFANFNDVIATNTDFKFAKLYKTKFFGSNLSNSDFSKSDNYYSEFKNSNLKNTNFQDARLSHVNFLNTDLTNSNFLDIFPIESKFENSNLDNAEINTCLKHDTVSRIINKILRTIDSWNFEFLEKVFVNICT
jgi:aldose sugar dehydrogenase